MTELFTFAAAFIARAIQQYLANRQEIRKHELELMSAQQNLIHEGRQTIRSKISNGWFSVTSSILAILAFFSIILLPKLIAIFYPEVGVSLAYFDTDKGFLFFTSDLTQMHFKQLTGLVITPMDTNLIAAIAGLYFGSLKPTAGRR